MESPNFSKDAPRRGSSVSSVAASSVGESSADDLVLQKVGGP
jgi:hypothetical protein